MSDKIDILLATYNGEKYIKEQLDSLLNQTYRNIRIVISDDASSDKTVSIINEYQQVDDRIELYINSKNMGFEKNFERLCSLAKSDICVLCDQDDVWKKEKIEKLYMFMKEKKAVLVYCDMIVADETLKTIYPSFHKYIKREKQCLKYHDFNLLKVENAVSGCSMMVKTEVLKSSIPFPSGVIVYDWWIALVSSQFGKIYYYNEPLQFYRQHSNNSIGATISAGNQSFEKYRNGIINFKINQYKILADNLDIFDKEKQYIVSVYESLRKIKSGKIKTECNTILYLYSTESIIRRIKMILLYNFPKCAKVLYNIRYKGAVK